MATPKATGRKPREKAAKPNLFARSKAAQEDKPKKKKGTVLQLPKDLDDSGSLVGDSKIMNEAVTTAIAAKRDQDAAKGRLGAALGCVHDHVVEAWCAQYAQDGTQPATPVTVLNHLGESLGFVIQDKSQQNAVSDDQVEALGLCLGEEVAASLVDVRDVYSFDSDTMKQAAGGPKAKDGETVQDVVFAIVSEALLGSPKLSDDQKAGLIASESKTYLKRNTLARLGELCGGNVGKILAVVESAGSAFVRYLKC